MQRESAGMTVPPQARLVRGAVRGGHAGRGLRRATGARRRGDPRRCPAGRGDARRLGRRRRDGDVTGGWLASFADADLDRLVAEALQANPDLRAAGARVEQSQAQLAPRRGCCARRSRLFGSGSTKFGSDLGGLNGAHPVGVVGTRPLGAVALCAQCRPRRLCVRAGRLRLRAAIACGAGGADLVHRDPGRIATRPRARTGRGHRQAGGSWRARACP